MDAQDRSTATPAPTTDDTSVNGGHQTDKDNNKEVIIKSPADITLAIHIQVFSGKTPSATSIITLPASKCTLLSDLRAEVVKACSERKDLKEATVEYTDDLLCHIQDLNKVTFRLEEDGHVATMNITRTKIDSTCAFPEHDYEAWYYRNILRGKQDVYKAEVKIEV